MRNVSLAADFVAPQSDRTGAQVCYDDVAVDCADRESLDGLGGADAAAACIVVPDLLSDGVVEQALEGFLGEHGCIPSSVECAVAEAANCGAGDAECEGKFEGAVNLIPKPP